jgi:hypothetical protein
MILLDIVNSRLNSTSCHNQTGTMLNSHPKMKINLTHKGLVYQLLLI